MSVGYGQGYGLYQEQAQKLMMTQQMQQAITMLQCSAVELDQYIQTELASNPLAEVRPVAVEWQMPAGIFTGGGRIASRSTGYSERQAPPLEQTLRSEATLADLLEEQIRLTACDSQVAHTAKRLIGSLDENGYLRETPEELAHWTGAPLELIHKAIELLQSCDPAGIAARDLQECLTLQLHLVPTEQRALAGQLIDHHLEEIAAGRISHLARALHVTTQEVQAAIDAIRQLNPRPGAGLVEERPAYIIPDVIVERVGGQYVVMTNESAQPSVRLDAAYRRWMRAADAETRQYLSRKVQAVEWIVRCLEQRRVTLHRVAEAIVQAQMDFLDRGPIAMRPLTLRQIADTLGVHESTVSRATRNKYMQTPRGVFEMKYFFTAELASSDGGAAASAEAAKHAIRQLIDAEDPAHPLSDGALCDRLASQGIHLSRRTVAKYREAMRIPSSSRRRRF
ncbi:RNA polymerase factor sigma-54 [Alicyclobacillus cycloheptanicus]|uniref:RNA polymerase sigma-54 factor n=1 Tax=Alicyclobacillus cycloheptanicus TaxID=1457 RepID=A0ABT9XH88_9BACL|nr:RNA polymerase factor sigma-54 [Alicyclobacillus cycloheptanicus]MDQ0189669.1 RNA polymerase sigma-54 factor [Alicyclobacillus cycloheptanicus]WDL99968.1 RNA polymerase factor sigma-54 [Alicyclobacillus cycloheptanicus]